MINESIFVCLVTADEEAPADFVRVQVVIPGLKKKMLGNGAANATVDFKPQTRYHFLPPGLKLQAFLITPLHGFRSGTERK